MSGMINIKLEQVDTSAQWEEDGFYFLIYIFS